MKKNFSTSIKEKKIITKLFSLRPIARSKSFQLRAHRESSDISCASVLIAIPKKAGNAVLRNKLRRRLRSILYQLFQNQPFSFHYAVLQAKPASAKYEYQDLQIEIQSLFKKL